MVTLPFSMPLLSSQNARRSNACVVFKPGYRANRACGFTIWLQLKRFLSFLSLSHDDAERFQLDSVDGVWHELRCHSNDVRTSSGYCWMLCLDDGWTDSFASDASQSTATASAASINLLRSNALLWWWSIIRTVRNSWPCFMAHRCLIATTGKRQTLSRNFLYCRSNFV